MTDVAGKPFPEVLRETVLEPAGMIRSTFEQPLPEALAANAAREARQGDYEAAQAYHEQACAYWPDLGDRWGLAFSLSNLGFVARSGIQLHQQQRGRRAFLELRFLVPGQRVDVDRIAPRPAPICWCTRAPRRRGCARASTRRAWPASTACR